MIKLVHSAPVGKMPVASPDYGLAVITCHFNFGDFDRPRQNLCRFSRQMFAAGVPVYGVELYRTGQQPFTAGWTNWIQIRCGSRSIMFQKEALLNLAEKMVPARSHALAWIDADVAFSNPDWPRHTLEVLENFNVTQLFTRGHLTGRDGRIQRSWTSCGSEANLDTRSTHTGFAWAARRELWRQGGMFPFSVTGAGDVIMAASFLDVPLEESYIESLGIDKGGRTFADWDAKVRRWAGGSVGYVGGDLYHEWHGDIQDRRYLERKAVLKVFHMERDVSMNRDSILEFTHDAPPALIEYVTQYFKNRREDG